VSFLRRSGLAPMNLFIDIETRSETDLTKTGPYVYAAHASTEILMCSWAVDDGPAACWIPFLGQTMPPALAAALAEPTTRFVAHNAGFERALLSSVHGRALGFPPELLDVRRWDCTAARAASLGLPRTLGGAAAALDLPVEKDKDGRALMLKMCKPRRPRKGERTDATLWHDTPAEVARLADYCNTDVVVERLLYRALPALSARERRIWELTERMNDTGITVDTPLLGRMLVLIEGGEARLDATICEKTGGAVPRVSDHGALTRWLTAQGIDDAADTGVGKAALAALIDNPEVDGFIRSVLILRRDGGGSSTKKYWAILSRLSADGRLRGAFVYCGAASTGRWSSRGAQLQNIARGGEIKDDAGKPLPADLMVRDILAGATVDEIETMYGPVLIVAAECLRPTFRAPL
jgi:DNA polymerase